LNTQAQWPPDYREIFIERLKFSKELEQDFELRRQIMTHYKYNRADWVRDWCVTYDPRKKSPEPKLLPLYPFDRQIDLLDFMGGCYDDGENGLIEKSRDMGASWIACAFATHLWLFETESACGFGSRKEEYVDKIGDPKSIFHKIRQIIQYLPTWMKPQDYSTSYMKIINHDNGSTITGEAGDNIGRGGRTSIYFKDESAHYERPDNIEAALGDNTDVQIDISSVNGTNNVFYRRRMAGEDWVRGQKCTKGMTRIFVMDWRDHPNKTQEWYDTRRARAAREGLLHMFAQEVDRDYTSAIEGIIIPPDWVKSAIDAHKILSERAENPITGWKTGKKISALDVADEGGDKNAEGVRDGTVLYHCEHWGEGDTGETTRKHIRTCREHGVEEFYYDGVGVGAGVKSETNRLKEAGELPENLRIYPWLAGNSPLRKDEHLIANDTESPIIKDFLKNLKDQGWWELRIRFEKTHKAVKQGAVYEAHELISLDSDMPRIHELELQLSQATVKKGSLKFQVDKKPDGATSPNLADMVVICYHPTRQLSILDVL